MHVPDEHARDVRVRHLREPVAVRRACLRLWVVPVRPARVAAGVRCGGCAAAVRVRPGEWRVVLCACRPPAPDTIFPEGTDKASMV
ncbi:hypothetical protein GCM10010492_15100 [Saccharothrix mutabilis subsp. mutabilis]|uniref:Uncharacterized protein n=1 Tax=Saccharothrix mutabilis subsp. mutabilis TaxID=66855 RepID=A0ABN0TCE6_9PSEU